jgi:enamine deaminase RidA (YjgF/YER057c/UK114 family)
MGKIEARLKELGLELPGPLKIPPGTKLPFPWANMRGDRVFVSGHAPQDPDGSLAKPLGKVGAEVTVEQGYELARKTALAMLGSLKRELGDLDRIVAWNRVLGMVNVAPGFDATPAVINGFSELIVELFGDDVGRHSRSAVGMAALPFSIAVEIEADVTIRV